jgi:hypothetical protein
LNGYAAQKDRCAVKQFRIIPGRALRTIESATPGHYPAITPGGGMSNTLLQCQTRALRKAEEHCTLKRYAPVLDAGHQVFYTL